MYWSHATVNPLEVYRSASRIVILQTYWCQTSRQDLKVFRNRDKCHESPPKKNFAKVSEKCPRHAYESEESIFPSIQGLLVGMLQQLDDAVNAEMRICQGKVEMSPRWQSRNVPFCPVA